MFFCLIHRPSFIARLSLDLDTLFRVFASALDNNGAQSDEQHLILSSFYPFYPPCTLDMIWYNAIRCAMNGREFDQSFSSWGAVLCLTPSSGLVDNGSSSSSSSIQCWAIKVQHKRKKEELDEAAAAVQTKMWSSRRGGCEALLEPNRNREKKRCRKRKRRKKEIYSSSSSVYCIKKEKCIAMLRHLVPSFQLSSGARRFLSAPSFFSLLFLFFLL